MRDTGSGHLTLPIFQRMRAGCIFFGERSERNTQQLKALRRVNTAKTLITSGTIFWGQISIEKKHQLYNN